MTVTQLRAECGVYRHAWFEADSDWATRKGGTQVTVRCERCSTERREVWTRSGVLVYRTYVYPQAWHDSTRPASVDEMRKVMLALRRKGYTSARGKTIRLVQTG